MNENTSPDQLLEKIAKPRLTPSLLFALAAHLLLLGIFSIGFIQKCVKYQTVHPQAAILKLAKEEARAEAERKREETLKRAQLKAKEEREAAAAMQKNTKETPELKGSGESAIEKTLNETLPIDAAIPSTDGLF